MKRFLRMKQAAIDELRRLSMAIEKTCSQRISVMTLVFSLWLGGLTGAVIGLALSIHYR